MEKVTGIIKYLHKLQDKVQEHYPEHANDKTDIRRIENLKGGIVKTISKLDQLIESDLITEDGRLSAKTKDTINGFGFIMQTFALGDGKWVIYISNDADPFGLYIFEN